MVNPFRIRKPNTVSAPWRRQFRVAVVSIILLKIISLIVLWHLTTEVQRDPTPVERLPTPPGGVRPLPVDEWAIVQGQMVQLTPEFAAKRREIKTQIHWVLAINLTLTTALVLCVVALGIRIPRARRARRAGLCAACGYDLRGLGERDPCPECGCSPTAL